MAVDGNGETTIDAKKAVALLPLGGAAFGYKGSGLATMVDLLCTIFTGGPPSAALPSFDDVSAASPTPLGHFFLALDGGAFRGAAASADAALSLVQRLRGCEPVAGGIVQAPGDPEKTEASRRRVQGVPVDRTTWSQLADIAREINVEIPAAIEHAG